MTSMVTDRLALPVTYKSPFSDPLPPVDSWAGAGRAGLTLEIPRYLFAFLRVTLCVNSQHSENIPIGVLEMSKRTSPGLFGRFRGEFDALRRESGVRGVHVLYLDGCSNESTDEIFGFLVIRIASLQAYGMPILAETEPNRDQN